MNFDRGLDLHSVKLGAGGKSRGLVSEVPCHPHLYTSLRTGVGVTNAYNIIADGAFIYCRH